MGISVSDFIFLASANNGWLRVLSYHLISSRGQFLVRVLIVAELVGVRIEQKSQTKFLTRPEFEPLDWQSSTIGLW